MGFLVKYRKALLDDEVAAIVGEMATEIAERFPRETEAIGTNKNHIHLLYNAHPKRLREGVPFPFLGHSDSYIGPDPDCLVGRSLLLNPLGALDFLAHPEIATMA